MKLFAEDMIAYVEKKTKNTKLLKWISECIRSKHSTVNCIFIHGQWICGYQIKIFVYTRNEHVDTKLKNIVSFTVVKKSSLQI